VLIVDNKSRSLFVSIKTLEELGLNGDAAVVDLVAQLVHLAT
jgi:hypothetical protein